MRIAIFGATGSVGSTLLVHMMKGSSLHPGDEIILVGRGTAANSAQLLAMQTDFLDAFDAGFVRLSFCPALEQLPTIDIFIMAAGQTISEQHPQRQDLADVNIALFRLVALSIAKTNPDCIAIIVSNPVELAVQVFSQQLERRQVIGMGAQQDSLRFARAVATHLGIPRASVRASVVGEHGPGMIPLWSSVHLVDSDPEHSIRLDRLRSEFDGADIGELISHVQELIDKSQPVDHIRIAYADLAYTSPEVRVRLEPLLTSRVLHSTPNATANATMDCLQALIEADDRIIHGQVVLQGEFEGVQGVFGAPLALRRSGWRVISLDPLNKAERIRVTKVNEEIERTYKRFFAASLEVKP